MKKKMFAFALITMIFAMMVNAQPFKPGQGCPNANPEMRQDVHEKIFPLISSQRLKLDKTLNETDKAEIARIRTELNALRAQHLAKRKDFKGSDEIPSLEQRQEMRAMRIQMGKLMDEATVITDKYDPTIITLLDEIRPEIEKVRQENCPAGKGYNNNCPNAPQGKKHQRRGGKGQGMPPGEGFHFQRMLTPEGFILLDPAEPFPTNNAFGISDDQLEVSIFPNPASQSTQISIALDKQTQVKVLLLDGEGNELKKVAETDSNAGIFSTNVDISNLKDGLYFIQIQAGNKSATQRLIVKH